MKILTLLILLVAIGTAHAAEERREYRWQFPARDVAGISVEGKIGNIRVVADRKDRLEIRAVRIVRAKRRELVRALVEDSAFPMELRDREIRLVDRWPSLAGDEKDVPEIRFELEIHAPAGIALDTRLEQGETRIEGATSVLTVRTGSGAVRLSKQDVSRNAVVSVAAGMVEIDGRFGGLTVAVGNGQLRAERIDAGGAESVVLESSTGELRAAFRSLPRTELRVQTGTGNATLKIPGSARATATVITANGKAHSDFKIPRATSNPGDTGAYLTGTIGGGGVGVKLQTGSGNVSLERG
jgi:hypothetical protein